MSEHEETSDKLSEFKGYRVEHEETSDKPNEFEGHRVRTRGNFGQA